MEGSLLCFLALLGVEQSRQMHLCSVCLLALTWFISHPPLAPPLPLLPGHQAGDSSGATAGVPGGCQCRIQCSARSAAAKSAAAGSGAAAAGSTGAAAGSGTAAGGRCRGASRDVEWSQQEWHEWLCACRGCASSGVCEWLCPKRWQQQRRSRRDAIAERRRCRPSFRRSSIASGGRCQRAQYYCRADARSTSCPRPQRTALAALSAVQRLSAGSPLQSMLLQARHPPPASSFITFTCFTPLPRPSLFHPLSSSLRFSPACCSLPP